MKIRIISVLFVILACFVFNLSVLAAEDMSKLVDNADLLTESEKVALMDRLDSVSGEYQVDIVIATVETLGGYTPDTYIENFYDYNNYGYGENRDGVMLLVAMDEREYRILSNGLGADAISSQDIESIGDTIAPYLTDGDYEDAFNIFIDECEYQIDGEINGFPFAFFKNLMISLAIGFAVAFLITGYMRSKLKSVKKQVAASEYTKQGSMQVTSANEFYLYRVVDRRRKANNSTSGSSGPSRNVGGGRF